jgi:hypothetical protein
MKKLASQLHHFKRTADSSAALRNDNKKPSFTTKSLPLYNKKKLAATQQKTRR